MGTVALLMKFDAIGAVLNVAGAGMFIGAEIERQVAWKKERRAMQDKP